MRCIPDYGERETQCYRSRSVRTGGQAHCMLVSTPSPVHY